MNFFTMFRSKSKLFWVNIGILGMINSIWASSLLFIINKKISGTPLPLFNDHDWILFVVLLIVSFIVSALFQAYMIRMAYNLGNDLALEIFDKLRFTNFQDYLKYGEDRVRAVIQDVHTLQQFPSTFLEFFNSGVMVIIGAAYLFLIDATAALMIFGMLIVLVGVYAYRNKQISYDLNAARDLGDVYQDNINDFVGGFKEIKMSIEQSDNIYKDFLVPNRNNTRDLTVRALIRQLGNELMGGYGFYIMIGAILFVFPAAYGMETSRVSAFLITLMFIMGPIAALVKLMEVYIHMKVALNRINEFNEIIQAPTLFEMGHGDLTEINTNFQQIEFKDITFQYAKKDTDKSFKLYPINLTLKKGECIFVTGGNGSGKSTFINLLTGLFLPTGGQILLNDHEVTDKNRPYYRDQISAIFTDNYLPNENYSGLNLSKSNQRFMDLLEMMELTSAIHFDEEKNRVSHSLSKGQQKRMALIYALLQDKDILVFDEWAAEQDPVFRRHFYRVILKELKKQGKTVIAVTHDDAYYDCAERIIKFDYGKIVKDEVVAVPV